MSDFALRLVEPEAEQVGMAFPAPLADKYMPRRVADFIGIEHITVPLSAFIANPHEAAWLFVGPPGVGKTAMGIAMCNDVNGELRQIDSRQCNLESVNDVAFHVRQYPWLGKRFHFVLVNEANEMTAPAQDAWLSMLDGSGRPAGTIFVFTTNSTDRLAPRFQSRCLPMTFGAPRTEDIAAALEHIWFAEINAGRGRGNQPDFMRLAYLANGDFRAAIGKVELALLGEAAPPVAKPEPKAEPGLAWSFSGIHSAAVRLALSEAAGRVGMSEAARILQHALRACGRRQVVDGKCESWTTANANRTGETELLAALRRLEVAA